MLLFAAAFTYVVSLCAGKTLLQFEQSLLNVFLVSDSDVAPHTVGTSRNTRHFL